MAMKGLLSSGAFLAPLLASVTMAQAAPTATIEHAVARVTVVLEPRSDIEASLVKANKRFPIWITRTPQGVEIHGDLDFAAPNCHGPSGHPHVFFWLRGPVGYDDMPRLVIRAPRTATVKAGGAVFGAVGPGDNFTLANSGCGDWTVADQTGTLRINLAGSGDVRAGSVGAAEVHGAGSADVALGVVRDGLSAALSGSGDVSAKAVSGPLHVRLTGSGDVRIPEGMVSDMTVSIAGSGDVRFGGVARSLDARIAGSGDVTVARVTGAISKHIAGSGDVRIGR